MAGKDSGDTQVVGAGGPTMDLPDRAEVVIVGGGVRGVSIAYHLARAGWEDVLLLERHALTAGSTWHAAGLITAAGFADETTLWMSEYTRRLYQCLEDETGLATGFMPIGHIHVATTPARLEAMKREQAFQRGFGLETELISAAEVAEMWPMARTDDIVGAIYNPNDGRANPVDVTMSLARGARERGARIVEGVGVDGLVRDATRVTGVATAEGDIGADHVVLAAGMWTRPAAASQEAATRTAVLLGPVVQPRELKTLRIRLESYGARRTRSPFLGAQDGARFLVEFDHEPGGGADIADSSADRPHHRFLGSWRP